MFELSVAFQLIVAVSVFFVWTLRYDNVVKSLMILGIQIYSEILLVPLDFIICFTISRYLV